MSNHLEAAVQKITLADTLRLTDGDPRAVTAATLAAVNHLAAAVQDLERKERKR